MEEKNMNFIRASVAVAIVLMASGAWGQAIYTWGNQMDNHLVNGSVFNAGVVQPVIGLGDLNITMLAGPAALTTDGDVYILSYEGWDDSIGTYTVPPQVNATKIAFPGGRKAIFISGKIYGQSYSRQSNSWLAIMEDGTVFYNGINVNYDVVLCHNSSTPVDWFFQLNIPSGLTVIKAAMGQYHMLVQLSNGTVLACGSDAWGQLGIGTGSVIPVYHLTPVVNLNGLNISDMQAGCDHSIILLGNGSLLAWGDNQYGELGREGDVNDNTQSSSSHPLPVVLPSSQPVVQLSAGCHFQSVLLADGQVYVWGDNTNGQLGINSTALIQKTPVQPMINYNVTALAAGADFLVLNTTDGVYACGTNGYKQVGTSSAYTVPVPTKVTTLPAGRYPAILSANQYHTLALMYPLQYTTTATFRNAYYLWQSSTTNGWNCNGTVCPVVPPAARLRSFTLARNYDGTFVNSTIAPGQTSSTFGFASDSSTNLIPDNAKITGARIEILRKASAPGIVDSMLTIWVNGTTLTSANLCASPSSSCAWPSDDYAWQYLGGQGFTFGTVITPALANGGNLCGIVQIVNNGTATIEASIDRVFIRYWYSQAVV